MLCLLYGHMMIYDVSLGRVDTVLLCIGKSMGIYDAYFMQTFFMITGFCSSFNNNAKAFLLKNVKTLILPSLVLTVIGSYFRDLILCNPITLGNISSLTGWLTIGGPWFIIALFWSKIILWGIVKVRREYAIAIIVGLYILGFTLNEVNIIANIQFHRHAFMMLPYLYIGYFLKGKMELINRYLVPLAIFAFISIGLQNLLRVTMDYPLPLQNAYIQLKIYTVPIHFLNVITGTAFVIWISQKLERTKWLSTLGKGSLTIYMLDPYVQLSILSLTSTLYIPTHWTNCTIYHLSCYVLCVAIMYLIIRILYNGSKYTSWIIGKW